MIVRKLRLQRGWTQEHLAQITGLSVRSIQRIERGQSFSLETQNSLAAVFEVERSILHSGDATGVSGRLLSSEEAAAIVYVKGLRDLGSHVFLYVLVVIAVGFASGFQDPLIIWGSLGWGVGVLAHGLTVYGVMNIFGPDWERRQIEKRLGRKAQDRRQWGNHVAIVVGRVRIQTWRAFMMTFTRLYVSAATIAGIALFAWVSYDATNVVQSLGLQARMDEASVAVLTLSIAACLVVVGMFAWRRTLARPVAP